MKFEIKKKLVTKSDRVKSVDFHPQFPWVLIGLYSGVISIYDYNTQASLQYLEVTNKPIRAAKFIADKNLFICGSDDNKLRVYNYNTMEKIKEFEAHSDYIRSIIVSIKENKILTSSDDQLINLWDLETFTLIRSYDEHEKYVMKLALNPKETNMFASASLDKKVKLWDMNQKNSSCTIEGHQRGINVVVFCPLNDKPYIATGGDDRCIKIWDYTNKACIATLEGHEDTISSLAFHPELPIIISGSEDFYCKFWNMNTFKQEDSKMFGYDTIWEIATEPSQNMVAFGCEEATVVLRMGSEQPLAIFNPLTSKIIFSKQNSFFSINLKQISLDDKKDGENIEFQSKSLGTTDIFPMQMKFSPNGRNFSVVSDKEFVISPNGVYRSSCVGNCTELAWNEKSDSQNEFAIKDGTTIRIYKNLVEHASFKPGFTFDTLFNGPYLTIVSYEALYIFDFENQVFLRKIDVCPINIIWSDNKKRMSIICEDITYILTCNNQVIENYIETANESEENNEDGCDDAFEPLMEINDNVTNGLWYGDVFVYLTSKNKLNYIIDEEIFTITNIMPNYFLLGFHEGMNRLIFMNKSFNMISYLLPVSFVNYQSFILKKEYEQAEKLYDNIPKQYLDKVSKFLEKFKLYELSYKKTTNIESKFDLAIKLKKLSDAQEIANELNNKDKWKIIADLAMDLGEFNLAEKCMHNANDYNGLLFYYSCISDKQKLHELAIDAEKKDLFNIAFNCYYQVNNLDKCIDLLINSDRIPEAALFCRTYCPSKLNEFLDRWNVEINNIDPSNRTNIKVLNPLSNIENIEKITKNEKVCKDFYSLSNNVDIANQKKLCKFVDDVDLDKEDIEESEQIMALLDIK